MKAMINKHVEQHAVAAVNPVEQHADAAESQITLHTANVDRMAKTMDSAGSASCSTKASSAPKIVKAQKRRSFSKLRLQGLLSLVLLFALPLFAETLALQSFESQATDTWSYTANPTPNSKGIWRDPTPPVPPVVSNVTFSQRTDGSGLVDIYYDLYDANGDNSTVGLLLSTDGGASFGTTPTLEYLSGDIGVNITNGTAKHITWNADAEAGDYDNNNYQLRVTAEDNSYPPVAIPVFTPEGGIYSSAQTVSITCATSVAEIRYTTDGSEPTESSALYSIPLTIPTTTTLKAKAFKELWTASETATAVYTITVPEGLAYVPAGTFTMGDTRGGGSTEELPTHSVTLNAFYMGKYEVTQGEYQNVMGSNPAQMYGVGTNYPVYYVNWYAVIKYCNLRSMNEGLTPVYTISGTTNPANWGAVPTYGINATWEAAICNWSANGYRLPTEAEWEYAARGGTNTPDYLYSGSDDINAVAWTSDNSSSTAHIVGTKNPNALGIYDMSGNEHEWCWDWYSSYSSSPSSNPTGPISGSYRVLRGGVWFSSVNGCRVARRDYDAPYYSSYYIGFRVVRVSP